MVNIEQGDVKKVLSKNEEHVFDSVVTDPPYELGFMGKKWDDSGIAFDREMWSEVYRTMKPGAWVCAFSGTRTHHRMMEAMDDVGFDMYGILMWVYGCLSEDTEILTEDGWKSVDEYNGEKVACWDSGKNEIRLSPIQNKFVYEHDGDMIRFQNHYTDQLLTPNHRVYYKKSCEKKEYEEHSTPKDWNVNQAKDVLGEKTSNFPLSSYHNGEGMGGTQYARLLAYVEACGRIDGESSRVKISHNSENREHVNRIDNLLKKLEISFEKREVEDQNQQKTVWFIKEPEDLEIDFSEGILEWDLLWNMTLEEKEVFVETTLALSEDNAAQTSSRKEKKNWFQALLHCTGEGGIDSGDNNSQLDIHSNSITQVKPNKKEGVKNYNGRVWCVETPTGAFMARRNGKAFITGNSGFPKNHDVSKAIDKELGKYDKREVVGKKSTKIHLENLGDAGYGEEWEVTDPYTDEAKKWEGWGTALKPAYEPIALARKKGDKVDPDLSKGSRFFYCPKAKRSERNIGCENNEHPTVKPIELISYLVRLITPQDGKVLDPFVGSGSTAISAVLENRGGLGIELDDESYSLASKRVKHVKNNLIQVYDEVYSDPSNNITKKQASTIEHGFWGE